MQILHAYSISSKVAIDIKPTWLFKHAMPHHTTDLTQCFWCEQVYYIDSTFAMGHVVIRRKRNVVGDEPQYVILFRCIQNMNPVHAYNTCFTGG